MNKLTAFSAYSSTSGGTRMFDTRDGNLAERGPLATERGEKKVEKL